MIVICFRQGSTVSRRFESDGDRAAKLPWVKQRRIDGERRVGRFASYDERVFKDAFPQGDNVGEAITYLLASPGVLLECFWRLSFEISEQDKKNIAPAVGEQPNIRAGFKIAIWR